MHATVLRAVDDRVEDEALMTAVAVRADREAFARLFSRYAPKVKAHLVARGAAAGIADELDPGRHARWCGARPRCSTPAGEAW